VPLHLTTTAASLPTRCPRTHALAPQSFTREGDSLWVRVGGVPADIIRHVLPKGFIAVDGTSLTVCDVRQPAAPAAAAAAAAPSSHSGGGGGSGGAFTFMLIAHTQAHIALPRKAVGDRVNLEGDVLGKYAAAAADAAVARLGGAVAALEARLSTALAGLEGRLAALEAKAAAGTPAAER
jgi:riboflavin synthase